MKDYMKLSLCLIMLTIIMTFTAASRHGEKIHFQDSSELGELDIDERPGHGHGNRNFRGRGRGHHKLLPEFEEGIPGYPIKGPPQTPLVLPAHPGRGVGLQKQEFLPNNNNLPQTTPVTGSIKFEGPVSSPQPVQQFPNNPYAGNPFLSKFQISAVTPTNKYNSADQQGVTNQLPTSDKPVTTSTTTNPRRVDLLYGSNLLEEAIAPQSSDNVTFGDRGLFDTAPHCQSGQILVNNKCRVAV